MINSYIPLNLSIIFGRSFQGVSIATKMYTGIPASKIPRAMRREIVPERRGTSTSNAIKLAKPTAIGVMNQTCRINTPKSIDWPQTALL